MRLATLKIKGLETASIVHDGLVITIATLNEKLGKDWPTDILSILQQDRLDAINDWYRNGGKEQVAALSDEAIPLAEAQFGPLYRAPRKIFGIGLNYADHAADLAEKAPSTEPASFFKPDTAIIGPGDAIKIPLQSNGTTAEAELGVIFGKECVDVEREDWLSVVAGFTTIIDMTAEDILRRNPRYLTLSKSFESFFSFGPQLVTTDEIEDVMKLKVATIYNGEVHAENVVSNMTFPPDYLVSFHSKVMKMYPGDIISTGTPRAVHIKHGDQVACRIDGFATLECPVIDKKVSK
ncbi:MAG: fumarylacetoacetate hydrolase family protein [Deltaproteobacteria bacterium]|jgi:2-keto-4-pentenoate hydratase/2-oxohepta-3-ene-1,7-dioic acid hydratase in catechol pathway|nr:fumarylacetoacetate hydrolase family protein [Deltaproteobacteria bacterium]MCW8892499.1 fumarylacetoacetate hydrolase family protein [Deltaproteobacteria bacterium]MCW9049360.1 fumarylacetoacetate hydrolase family protein [Deltaproteobacteria bacterium]